MTTDFDVCIVGWGPVGATLGILLAQQGLSVCIFERENGIYPYPRATHFDGEAMRLFQTLGLADEILEDLRVHVGIRFLDADQNLLLHWPRPQTMGSQAWFDSYRFHQPTLEAVLRRHFASFANCRAMEGVNVFALDEQADGVIVRYEEAASFALAAVRCKYVVGSDGARSTVRRLMGSPVEELQRREQWLVVDLVCNGPVDLPDGTVQLCDPARPTTFAKCTGDRRRWEFMVMPGDDPATMAGLETVWKLLAPWLRPDQAEIERSVVYTFYALLVDGWRRGRMLVAGDAAHLMPPFLGQGLCSGLRDAANLAWKLAAVVRGEAGPHLLDSYESERSPHVKEYIDLAGTVGSIIQTTDPVAAAERNREMTASPPVMKTIQPPLGPGLHGSRPAPAGILSAQAMTADGARLDDAVGYAFALVLGARLSAQLGERLHQRLHDLGIVVVVRDDDPDSAMLIRPDRYILGIARDAAELEVLLSEFPVRARSDGLVAVS
jgi:3-(3-hydroxy-phenyl)propionate hydroxylase